MTLLEDRPPRAVWPPEPRREPEGEARTFPALSRRELDARLPRAGRLRTWLTAHGRTLAALGPVVLVTALVHARGMRTYPRWVDDPGTYLSQAWAFAYRGTLSPYSYFYDHTPLGWIAIGLWARLTGGFDRYATSIDFGNECMLIAKVVSVVLIMALGRRLGFHRIAAAVAGLVFALSPLALTYTRWTYLDNLVTPWLLLAFFLALSPRRGMLAGIGAGVAFAMAALTKETSLLMAPALLWALLQHSDRRNRRHVLTMTIGCSALLASLYVVYALVKGELLPGPGHVSLLGTAVWQLGGRESSGSVLTSGSSTQVMFGEWFGMDPAIVVAGGVACVVALTVPRLRPLVAVPVLNAVTLFTGGYVPYMHVVNFLPWFALLIGAAVEVLRGRGPLRPGWRVNGPARRPAGRWRRDAGAVATMGVLAVALAVVVPAWGPSLVGMTTRTAPPPLAEATQWIGRNAPRSSVVVVHDTIWTDLVQKYDFPTEQVVMAYKIDTDPAVQQELTHLDYLVVPNWYYTSSAGDGKYPTLVEARNHAVPAAAFGEGPDGVTVWRVASVWNPRR